MDELYRGIFFLSFLFLHLRKSPISFSNSSENSATVFYREAPEMFCGMWNLTHLSSLGIILCLNGLLIFLRLKTSVSAQRCVLLIAALRGCLSFTVCAEVDGSLFVTFICWRGNVYVLIIRYQHESYTIRYWNEQYLHIHRESEGWRCFLILSELPTKRWTWGVGDLVTRIILWGIYNQNCDLFS